MRARDMCILLVAVMVFLLGIFLNTTLAHDGTEPPFTNEEQQYNPLEGQFRSQLEQLRKNLPGPSVKQCFQKGTAKLMGGAIGNANGTRVYFEQYDQDGDGQADFELAYEFVGGDRLRPFPSSYAFDTNHDGQPDRQYMDIKGNGRCEDMVAVPVGSAFTGKRV